MSETEDEFQAADESSDGPRTVDVDVADIPVKTFKSESVPPLGGEAWVILGEHPDVPDWAVGHIAAVVNSPVKESTDDVTGATTYSLPKNAKVTVVEREQGAQFTLPLEAFSKISRDGRTGVMKHA